MLVTIHTNLSPLWKLIFATQPDAPPERPAGKCYVPEKLRIRLLRTYHYFKTASHPGKNQISWAILPLVFMVCVHWCCCVCPACNPKTNHPTIFLLCLLHLISNGECPWSHLTMHLYVDLPLSQGSTVNLMVVFVKCANMSHSKKLPTDHELAFGVCQEVFHFYGLPKETVLDRRNQLVPRFWCVFCTPLRILFSFSTAYHSQSKDAADHSSQALDQFLLCHIFYHQDN